MSTTKRSLTDPMIIMLSQASASRDGRVYLIDVSSANLGPVQRIAPETDLRLAVADLRRLGTGRNARTGPIQQRPVDGCLPDHGKGQGGTMTCSLKINFSASSNRRPYTRTGLDLESAINLKTYFIEQVPCAVSGWVEIEKEGKGKSK